MQIDYTETLTVTSCWCGIRLAIPDNLHRWLADAPGRQCYCPLGHTFVFRENYQTKLERERRQHRDEDVVAPARGRVDPEQRREVVNKGVEDVGPVFVVVGDLHRPGLSTASPGRG